MAKINIYGTLHNDTGEPIVAAEQISVTRQGKPQCMLPEYIEELKSGVGEELTKEEISAMLQEARQSEPDPEYD